MSKVTRYDQIHIGATITPEGFIKDTPIVTRSGIFEYKNKDGKMMREYRSPEEVFRADSLATLSGVPITDGHRGLISAENVAGILGTVIAPGERDGETLNVIAPVVIHAAKLLGNKRELSLGYTAEIVNTPGQTVTGERYDSYQKDIVYNHLAIVKAGRAGNARLRLDESDASSFEVENDVADKMTTIRIDEIEYAAAQEVARAHHRLIGEINEREIGYQSLSAERDSLKGQVAEAAQILSQAIMDAKTEVRERIALETIAEKHDVRFDDKTTDREIREKVILKIRGNSIKLDGKTDDYVSSSFDLAIDLADDKNKKIGEQRRVVTDQKEPNGEKMVHAGGAKAARARMFDSIRAGRSA